MTPEQTAQIEKARRDVGFFITEFCWGVDYQSGKVFRAKLWPGQQRLIQACLDYNKVIGLKSRGVGWTWGTCWLMLWEAWAKAPYQGLQLSDKQDKANGLLERTMFSLPRFPDWLGFPQPTMSRPPMDHVKLTNGSEFYALCGDPDSIRNYHPSRVFIDEWSKFRDQAIPALAGATENEAGSVVGIATADGYMNEYAEVWTDAYVNKGVDFGFHPIFADWKDRPDRKERPHTKKDIQKQEFPESPEEAFRASGYAFFDQDDLFELEARVAQPIGIEMNGSLIIWKEPQKNRQYVMGADVCDGPGDDDEQADRSFSAAAVLDQETGEQVAELHGRWSPHAFAHKLLDLRRRGYDGWIGVERNSMGVAVCEELQRIDGEKLLRHKQGKVGFDSKGDSRNLILAQLAHDVEDHSLLMNSKGFYAEARMFAEQPNGKVEAPRGKHDDRVMATAIARYTRAQTKRMGVRRKRVKGEPTYVGVTGGR